MHSDSRTTSIFMRKENRLPLFEQLPMQSLVHDPFFLCRSQKTKLVFINISLKLRKKINAWKSFFNFKRLNLGKPFFFHKPVKKSEASEVDTNINYNSSERSEGPISFFPPSHKCFPYVLDHISTKYKSYYHVKISFVLVFETTSYERHKL